MRETGELPLPPRDRPLSRKELSDLHSLLDPRRSPSKPLKGRKVMVPMTTKAFFEGALQPRDGQRNENKVGEEMVLVNLGQGYLAEVSREKASDLCARRIESAIVTPATKAAATTNIESDSPNQKKPAAGSLPKDAVPKKRATSSAHQPHTLNSSSPLPFFEIREEYDELGNEVRAEAINVSDELKHLKEMTKAGQSSDESHSRRRLDNLIQNLDIVERPEGVNAKETTGEDHASEDQHESSSCRIAMSDVEYKALTNRLDDLAHLEEEDAKKKRMNAKSAKVLQSKGWAKGFLQGDRNKKAKKKKNSAEAPLAGANAAASRPKSMASLSAQSTLAETNSARGEPPRQTKVVFHDQNEVREIPRIGQTKISSVRPSKPNGGGSNQPIPFEREAFTGTITERGSAASGIENGNGNGPNRPNNEFAQESNARIPESGERPQKKKLSRFAQERQQRR